MDVMTKKLSMESSSNEERCYTYVRVEDDSGFIVSKGSDIIKMNTMKMMTIVTSTTQSKNLNDSGWFEDVNQIKKLP